MSVTSTTNRKSYSGDAVTTSFATNPVVFFDSSDLAVSVVSALGVETALTENTHYAVTGGDGSTGTVNLAGGSAPYGAPAVGVTLLILRVVALTQPVDFVQNDGSDAEVQETAYDRLTMMVQQLNEVDARAIKLPPVETGSAALTELPFDRASKLLGFNSAKELIVYDPADGANDSASVTFVQSGTGAVSRTAQDKMRESVSVKDFGAVGDDSNDDTAEIQAALDSGAKRIFIPSGTYKITTALSVPSGVEFYGEGAGSILKLYANSDVVQVNGASNVSLHDFDIEGQRATYTSAGNDGVYIDWTSVAGSNVKVRNVNVREVGGVGILGLASSGTASSDVFVEGCTIENTGAHSIVFQDYISDIVVRRNVCKASGLGFADRPGITVSRFGERVVVSDNICIGSSSALGTSVHGISLDGVVDAVCHGNVVSGWKGYGIEIGGVTNGSVQGNSISGCGNSSIALSGINGTFRNTNISVIGNVCNDNAFQGINIFMTGGVATYLHQNVVIANNAVNGTTTQPGIHCEFVDRLTINGNSVYGANLSGIYVLDCKRVMMAGNNVTYNNCAAVKAVTSITLSGSTATVTSAGHGYSNADTVTVFGAVPAEYNGSFVISNVTTDTYDFTAGSGLASPAVGSIECTKPNNTAHAGIHVLWSTITTKETCVFGQNLVARNGFREVYDISRNGFEGFVNGCLYLKETKEPRVENLTSGEASNERDRVALFMNNNKFALAYNNAGTINFAVLDLDGSDTAWANGATAP